MNASEFEGALNALIINAMKSVEAQTMSRAQIVYALEIQKVQITQFFIAQAMAEQMAKQQSGIIIPRKPL